MPMCAIALRASSPLYNCPLCHSLLHNQATGFPADRWPLTVSFFVLMSKQCCCENALPNPSVCTYTQGPPADVSLGICTRSRNDVLQVVCICTLVG